MIETISIKRQAVIEAARSCVGTPFLHMARLPGVGLDCIGLLESAGAGAGFKAIEYPPYKRIPDGKSLMHELRRQLCEIDPADVRPGDVLVFFINRLSKKPQHVGIFTGTGLIHTWANVGKVVEHDYTEVWSSRVVSAFSFLEIG